MILLAQYDPRARTHPPPRFFLLRSKNEKCQIVQNGPMQSFTAVRLNFGRVNGRSKARIFKNAEFQTAAYPPKIGRTAVKLGSNPFRTILHISFFEAHFLGVAVPRPIRDRTAVRPHRILEILETVYIVNATLSTPRHHRPVSLGIGIFSKCVNIKSSSQQWRKRQNS